MIPVVCLESEIKLHFINTLTKKKVAILPNIKNVHCVQKNVGFPLLVSIRHLNR